MPATEDKVEFGVEHVVYALDEDDGSVGDTWVDLAGAVELNIEASSNENIFYADDGPYYTFYGNQSDSFTLNIARLPEQAKIDLLGYERDATSGGLLKPTMYKPKSFTLGYEYKGDTNDYRGIKYGCTLAVPTENHTTTNESTEANTVELTGTSIGKVFTVGNEEKRYGGAYWKTGDTGFSKFYTTPPQPGVAPANG